MKTAGKDTLIFYRPKSTSLVTVAFFMSSENSIFELKVADGIPRIDPSIYPVWLKSSSMDYFPITTKSNFLSFMIFAKILATAKGYSS